MSWEPSEGLIASHILNFLMPCSTELPILVVNISQMLTVFIALVIFSGVFISSDYFYLGFEDSSDPQFDPNNKFTVMIKMHAVFSLNCLWWSFSSAACILIILFCCTGCRFNYVHLNYSLFTYYSDLSICFCWGNSHNSLLSCLRNFVLWIIFVYITSLSSDD